ncbi:hypothetical protein ACIQNU_18095 [Streptomyces sp. NPDC091292]
MPKVVYRHADGTETTIDADAGQSVMRAAVQHGVPGIVGECGGETPAAQN